jgi:ribosomal protein L16/L10AE
MMHKGRPVTTTLLPGDEPAHAFPAVRDSEEMVQVGLAKPFLRSGMRLTPQQLEAARQAAARIAEPHPSAPTLVVAAFQSSI